MGPVHADAEETGWAVLHTTVAAAQARFGSRLVAAYALGSLAHGGFAPLVSDVDVGLLLGDLRPDDPGVVADLTAEVKASGRALADRVSVFWGSAEAVHHEAPGGRFPPLDRLDLIRHGVLVAGEDVRERLREPTYEELVVGTARFVIDVFGTPERRRDIVDARRAADGGARAASKVALFPVRFLYTAATGAIGQNEAAVRHYLAHEPAGPRADLVNAARDWRATWGPAQQERAASLLDAAAVPLYRQFAAAYVDLLTGFGDDALAGALTAWARTLDP